MFRNFKFLVIFITTFFGILSLNIHVYAQNQDEQDQSAEQKDEASPYAGPKVSGSILYQLQSDHIMSSNQ